MASAYAGAAQPQKALSFLRIAVSEAPWDSSLYYRMGKLHQQLGQAELARDAFENSRRLNNASREDVETIMRASSQAVEMTQPLPGGAAKRGLP